MSNIKNNHEEFINTFFCRSVNLHMIKLEDIDLSVRCFNTLKRAGLSTLGDVFDTGEYGVKRIKNMGRNPYEEISCALRSFGYELGSGEPIIPTNYAESIKKPESTMCSFGSDLQTKAMKKHEEFIKSLRDKEKNNNKGQTRKNVADALTDISDDDDEDFVLFCDFLDGDDLFDGND
ncbi:MAG: hypothetical protein IJ141_05685 [Lachnospiraceae bacterium]|nr:hypothetical protein [Lachnospiraceae bacterium]